MKNSMSEKMIAGAMVREIEDAMDSANLLALDLAIHAFENDSDMRDSHSNYGKAFKSAAERGLHATGMIERMLIDLHIS